MPPRTTDVDFISSKYFFKNFAFFFIFSFETHRVGVIRKRYFSNADAKVATFF